MTDDGGDDDDDDQPMATLPILIASSPQAEFLLNYPKHQTFLIPAPNY